MYVTEPGHGPENGKVLQDRKKDSRVTPRMAAEKQAIASDPRLAMEVRFGGSRRTVCAFWWAGGNRTAHCRILGDDGMDVWHAWSDAFLPAAASFVCAAGGEESEGEGRYWDERAAAAAAAAAAGRMTTTTAVP